MKKSYLYLFLFPFLLIPAVVYKNSHPSRTKEQTLRELMRAMKSEDSEKIRTLCTTEAFERLENRNGALNDTTLAKRLGFKKGEPSWRLWHQWANETPIPKPLQWRSFYGTLVIPVIGTREISLVFSDRDGLLKKIIIEVYR